MISIIIPTLQEENVIASTLSALQKFRALPHEIIVSDGGSTDRTPVIARDLADRVIVHNEPARQTIAQGRNTGAGLAQGQFLVFLDADCTIENPDKFFQKALAHFLVDPRLVALTGYLRVLPFQETLADRAILTVINLVTRFQNNVRQKGDAPGGEFQMVRKTAFESVGGYRADLVTCEDRDLFARLARVGRVLTDPELTVFHTGRRAHNIGWPRLFFQFLVNRISFRLRGKAVAKEWAPER